MSEHTEEAETRVELLGGSRWLRSSGYYIEDGLIRLRAGAELEVYDPWEAWRTAPDEERPYKRLLRLAQQLHPPRFFGPLPRREQRLLERWVQENGLLGILPHETLEATMAPRWVDAQELVEGARPAAAGERSFVAVQRQQRWEEQHWPIYPRRITAARGTDPALEGELVSAELAGDDALPLEVLRRRVQDGRLERCSLAEHYRGFFPDVAPSEAATYDYPGIDSERFWRLYAESSWGFVHTARYLAAPLAALPRLGGALDEDDRIVLGRALQAIDAIASVVDYAGALTEGDEFVIGWSSPSLLGMYALMLLTDLKAGHEVKRCPNCEVFFLARNARARYCSATCRHAQQKREWRKAKAQREGAGD